MAPFKSSKGRNLGKQVRGYKTSSIGSGLGSGGAGGSGSFSATGGTKYEPGDGYVYHVFTGPSAFIHPGSLAGDVTVQGCALLIAGGGGGGAGIQGPGGAAGGGGGAGGIIYDNNLTLTIGGPGPVVIGAGGVIAPPAYNVTGTSGADTTIALNPSLTLTGKGGGAGAMYNVDGLEGGSGGGAAFDGGSGGATNQAAANPGDWTAISYGTVGTDGNPDANIYNGSGGGGAGGAGTYEPGGGGVGGPAIQTLFTGSKFATDVGGNPGMPATWRTAVGSNGKFGQGGAGGTYSPNVGKTSGYAGQGGGGGSGPGAPTDERAGVDNTGSGGGGGDGGDGIVIIRYPDSATYTSA